MLIMAGYIYERKRAKPPAFWITVHLTFLWNCERAYAACRKQAALGGSSRTSNRSYMITEEIVTELHGDRRRCKQGSQKRLRKVHVGKNENTSCGRPHVATQMIRDDGRKNDVHVIATLLSRGPSQYDQEPASTTTPPFGSNRRLSSRDSHFATRLARDFGEPVIFPSQACFQHTQPTPVLVQCQRTFIQVQQ